MAWSHEVIAYTGDGVNDRVVSTSIPLDVGHVAVWVLECPVNDASVARSACFRNSAMATNDSHLEGSGPALFTNGIKTFTSSGFTVGTSGSVNGSGATYLALVIRDTTGFHMQVGIYTGSAEIIKNSVVGVLTTGGVIHDGSAPDPTGLWPSGINNISCMPGPDPPWVSGSFGSVTDSGVYSMLGNDATLQGTFYPLGSCWRMDPPPPFFADYRMTAAGQPSTAGNTYRLIRNGQQFIGVFTHALVFGTFVMYQAPELPTTFAMDFHDDVNIYVPVGGVGPGFIDSSGNVGPSERSNANGEYYAYVWFNDTSPGFPTGFAAFTGIGTGSDVSVTGFGFSPSFALARGAAAGNVGRWRTTVGTPGTHHPGTESQVWSDGGGAVGARDTTAGIKSMDADGVTVGTNVAPNGVNFYGFAFAATGQSTNITQAYSYWDDLHAFGSTV